MNYEVAVHFANNGVFGPKRAKTRCLSEKVQEWLDAHGGDWGLVNWYRPYVSHGEFGPEPGMEHVGRIFQFGERRTAQLFLLCWNASGHPKEAS